jgi:membrane protein
MSWRGWWIVLKRTAAEVADDNLTVVAAGVAFYMLLALFPALGAGISLWGLFADPTHVTDVIDWVRGALPREAITLLSEQLRRLVDAERGSLTLGSTIGLLISLWSANAGTKALLAGLNVAYEEKEERNFLTFNLQSLGITLGIIVTGLLAVAGVAAVPAVVDALYLGDTVRAVLRLLRWPVLAAVMMLALAVLYRFGPCRRAAQWQWVSPGAVAACVLWLLASAGFSVYADNFGSYDETYGSLAGVVLLMLWLWVSALVVLLGAELNAESEHQTRHDTTRPPIQPMGERGAYVADHLGEVPGK